MSKMTERINEILEAIKSNSLFFPSTWSDSRITFDENKFKTYLNDNRDYLSCEVTYKNGKSISFNINKDTVAIQSPLTKLYTLKDVLQALEVVIGYFNNRDYESEKARIISQITYYEKQAEDAKKHLKELRERKAEVLAGIKTSKKEEAEA